MTHFPLHPGIPPGGVLIRDLLAGRGYDIDAAHARLAAACAAEGLPFAAPPRFYDTRLAQELAAWGDDERGVPAIHGALFRAYFAEGRDLADEAVLVDVAGAVGLDREEARRVLAERTMRARVDADGARARQIGVTGVPTYVAGRQGVVGAQPYEVLERLAAGAGAKRR